MRRAVPILTLAVAGLAFLTTGRVHAVGLPPATAWDQQRAAHLLRRAGFGGSPAEVRRLAAGTIADAVDQLVDFERTPQADPDYQVAHGLDQAALRRAQRARDDEERRQIRQRLERYDRLQIEELRAWWLRRMIVTSRPLEERMTLFWHGHFTSGYREVRSAAMLWRQNALFREHALGDFRKLLVAVSQDPAMLRYLDNASNRKQAPNENYARELLELFTLGEGNYTEQDIREAARALTGWTLRDGQFASVPAMHDDGEKTILGRTGRFDGNDVIAIILDQPAAARHLARKLLVAFVRDDPPDADIELLAAVIRAHDFNLREVLRALLGSEMFYAPEALHAQIKSPVDVVVGTFRLLELEPVDMFAAARAARNMGQDLFQPPNVKGWDGGRAWISTATIYARYNFASALLVGTGVPEADRMMGPGRDPERMDRERRDLRHYLDEYPGLEVPEAQVEPAPQPLFDPTSILQRERLTSPDQVLNHFIERLLQLPVDPRQRGFLRELLVGRGRFDAKSADGKRRVVSLVNALLTMPEYQVK